MPCIIQIGKIKGDEFHIPTTPPFSLELRQTELPGKFLYNAAAASYTFHIVWSRLENLDCFKLHFALPKNLHKDLNVREIISENQGQVY